MTVRLTIDTITSQCQQMRAQLRSLPQQAFQEWQKNTPVRSGNARRRTRLQGDTIEARYPYAQRLDEGYSSQSPQGMSQPVEKFIQQQIKKILGK